MSIVRLNETQIAATSVLDARVDAMRDLTIPIGTKGFPLDMVDMTVNDYAAQNFDALAGDLPMPLALIRANALESNIAAMQQYCDSHGVSLCPHGKTTMAPQLFSRQLHAGAWGITAATPTHLRLYRHFGITRVLYANQLVDARVMHWLAAELNADPGFEFYCLVDSTDGVALLEAGLRSAGLQRPVNVLIEVGHPGGRCGVRDARGAADVAAAVDNATMMRLTGVECFEGLLAEDLNDMPRVGRFLAAVAELTNYTVSRSSLRHAEAVMLSAGGSAYFDHVIQTFVYERSFDFGVHVVLRSGCYITHDGGFYSTMSPSGRGRSGAPVLTSAIEVWGTILARPEPDFAVVGLGRRDCSHDMGMPRPHLIANQRGRPAPLTGARVSAMSDQHAHLHVDDHFPGSIGDLVGMQISHPCTTFDKWKVIPLVDDDYRVVDAIITAF